MNNSREFDDARRDAAVKANPDLAMPPGLSEMGQRAWRLIMDEAIEMGATHTGGCKAFYSPKEWLEREEEYGLGAELVVVYDGAELKYLLSLDSAFDAGDYSATDRMVEKLAEIGMYPEECTCWYAAIYEA